MFLVFVSGWRNNCFCFNTATFSYFFKKTRHFVSIFVLCFLNHVKKQKKVVDHISKASHFVSIFQLWETTHKRRQTNTMIWIVLLFPFACKQKKMKIIKQNAFSFFPSQRCYSVTINNLDPWNTTKTFLCRNCAVETPWISTWYSPKHRNLTTATTHKNKEKQKRWWNNHKYGMKWTWWFWQPDWGNGWKFCVIGLMRLRVLLGVLIFEQQKVKTPLQINIEFLIKTAVMSDSVLATVKTVVMGVVDKFEDCFFVNIAYTFEQGDLESLEGATRGREGKGCANWQFECCEDECWFGLWLSLDGNAAGLRREWTQFGRNSLMGSWNGEAGFSFYVWSKEKREGENQEEVSLCDEPKHIKKNCPNDKSMKWKRECGSMMMFMAYDYWCCTVGDASYGERRQCDKSTRSHESQDQEQKYFEAGRYLWAFYASCWWAEVACMWMWIGTHLCSAGERQPVHYWDTGSALSQLVSPIALTKASEERSWVSAPGYWQWSVTPKTKMCWCSCHGIWGISTLQARS